MKFKLILITLISTLLVSFSIVNDEKMSASEIQAFKNKVEEENKKTTTIKTDFVQYKHMDFLSKDIETKGNMYFKKPNMLSWMYHTPYKYSIIFKNKKVYINDQGKKSTVDGKLFEKINNLIVGSVSGNLFNDSEFTISYFKNKEFYIAKLVPKTSVVKKYIKQVDMYFNLKDATINQVKMIEPSNDYTKIIFKNRVLNAPIDEKYFSN